MKAITVIIGIALVLLPNISQAQYQCGNCVVCNGGGQATGETYQIVNAVIGESIIGQDTTESIIIRAGFSSVEYQDTIPDITYYVYFGTYNPGFGPGPVIQITLLGEQVAEGESFIIPDYDLQDYPILGESFQIYMNGVSGTTVLIEEGALNDDIEIHLILSNLIVSGGIDSPMELEEIYSPDNAEELWMFSDIQAWSADPDSIRLDVDEPFNFENDCQMVINVPLDEDFYVMFDSLDIEYEIPGAAIWLGEFEDGEWNVEELETQIIENDPDSLQVVLGHTGRIGFGRENGFCNNWYIHVEAAIGNAIDRDNYVGGAEGATRGYDADFDIPEPPHTPGQYIRLYFPHDEWEELVDNFTSDVVGFDAYEDSVIVWNFEVETNVENEEIALQFSPDDNVPEENMFLFVLDGEEIDSVQNLRQIDEYAYNSQDGGIRTFQLVFADREPSITVDYPNGGERLNVGDNITVTWNAVDDIGISSSVVSLSRDNGMTWEEAPIGETEGETFELEWNVPDLYSPFCLIRVTSFDIAGQSVNDESDDCFAITPTFAETEVALTWNLISLPLIPEDNDIDAVFGDDIDGAYFVYGYRQEEGYTRPDTVSLGKGYWFFTSEEANIDVTGEARIIADTLDLDQGWNLIGDPFPMEISIDSVHIASPESTYTLSGAIEDSLVQEVFYGSRNGDDEYFNANVLQPWSGYWTMALQENLQMIIHPTLPGEEGLMPMDLVDEVSPRSWRLVIAAQMENSADRITALGVDEDATDNFDVRFDHPEPPVPPGDSYISAYFEHDWEGAFSTRFNRDIRSVMREDETVTWLLNVVSGEDGEVTLSWPDIEDRTPHGYTFTLRDPENDHTVNLLESETYTFMSDGLHEFDIEVGSPRTRELVLQMYQNWNIISINITPEDEDLWVREEGPDVVLMLDQLRIDEENHHIELFKDYKGRFYSPGWDFNNIPYWNLTEGYLVKVDGDVEGSWTGMPIPADTDIHIKEGWKNIAYFPRYELDAGVPDFYVLSPIIDHVLMAKNANGQFMSPPWEFSNMPPWRETQGYQVKVDTDVVLNYPPEQDEGALAAVFDREYDNHWSAPVSTGENMSILLSSFDFTIDDQVAAFGSDGNITGVGIVDSDSRCGLAIWGDDASTEAIDGLQKGEAFELRLWNAEQETEFDLVVTSVSYGAGLVYESNDYSVLDVKVKTPIPEEFYLSEAYPNPFNSLTKLTYGLPEASLISIRVYDVSGRLMAVLVDGQQSAGHHSVVWNAQELSSGVYLVRIDAANFSTVRKVALIR